MLLNFAYTVSYIEKEEQSVIAKVGLDVCSSDISYLKKKKKTSLNRNTELITKKSMPHNYSRIKYSLVMSL